MRGIIFTTQIDLGEVSDQLLVDGDVSLDGALNVELLGGFIPGQHDEFPVVTAITLDGGLSHYVPQGHWAEGYCRRFPFAHSW